MTTLHDAEAYRRFDAHPPEGWIVRQSTTRPGVFYYVNRYNGETAVERPAPVRDGGAKPATSIPNIHSIWVGRDRLLDWQQKLGQRFNGSVVGFYIRFRLEDQPGGKAHYKVGRIRGVTEDWHIYVDLGKGVSHRGDTTGIDCVSNSIFTSEEVRAWYDGLDHSNINAIVNDLYHTEMRLRSIESEVKAMGGESKPRKDRRSVAASGFKQQPSNYDNWARQRYDGPPTPGPGGGGGGDRDRAKDRPSASSVLTPPSPPTPPGVHMHGAGSAQVERTPHGARARSRSRSRSHSRSPPPRDANMNQGAPIYRHHPPVASLSPYVLLIDEQGETKGHCLISEVVSRATCVEPDTPMGTHNGFNPFENVACTQEQDIMGTESTIMRVKELEAGDDEFARPPEATTVLHMILEATSDNGKSFHYPRPREFATAILQLCRAVRPVLEREPTLTRLSSPLYVFGDIHGNFSDLYYFMKNIICFGELQYTPADLLFLGDYVDRGTCSVECIAFLLAYKLLAPNKITLLRGNHESPEVSGDVATYGTVSFRHQCLTIFGDDIGTQVWHSVNGLFKYLSLAAIVDDRIFCAHGGIPQYYGGPDTRLDILDKNNFPRFDEVQSSNPDPDTREYRQFVSDLLWSDPAEPTASLNEHGFGQNPRGPGIKTFGSQAVDTFLNNFGFDYIFRAHQEKSNGLRLCDNARVITIFSSSDYGGHQNGAGVLFLNKGKIRMVIKDPPTDDVQYRLPRRGNAWA
eukprot:Sspe_Gene.9862::Locus_3317_Transcript_1_4_Confidence_0.429_Length_2420::g.9862::m.9862